jgi:N-acyl-D-aspartate/D-glutamate deacylase
MIKRFNDPTQMPKIEAEMKDNLRRRNGPHSILFPDKGQPWTGKYLDEVAKEWKVEPIDAVIRILRQTQHQSVVSFNMSQPDLDNFMKQPWVVTSSDGGPGHPREWATFPTKYVDYVKNRHVISMGFFIRHTTGLAADMFMLDHRGYLRNGYYADVLVFNPNTYAPKADYVHTDTPSTGVLDLLVNGKAAVDNGKLTDVLSGQPLPHTPTPGTCT